MTQFLWNSVIALTCSKSEDLLARYICNNVAVIIICQQYTIDPQRKIVHTPLSGSPSPHFFLLYLRITDFVNV